MIFSTDEYYEKNTLCMIVVDGEVNGFYSGSFHILDLNVPLSVQPTMSSEKDLCLAHSKCSINL